MKNYEFFLLWPTLGKGGYVRGRRMAAGASPCPTGSFGRRCRGRRLRRPADGAWRRGNPPVCFADTPLWARGVARPTGSFGRRPAEHEGRHVPPRRRIGWRGIVKAMAKCGKTQGCTREKMWALRLYATEANTESFVFSLTPRAFCGKFCIRRTGNCWHRLYILSQRRGYL